MIRPSLVVVGGQMASQDQKAHCISPLWPGSRPAPTTPMTCCAEASISATSSPRCKAAMLNTLLRPRAG